MKKYVLTLALLSIILTVAATERPAARMRQAAGKTLNSVKAKSVLSKPTLEVYSDGTRSSVVSRDDRFPEVLAYGVGSFDIEQAPANVRWWFERIQYSMEKAVREDAPRHAGRAYIPIAPLLETKWGQGDPYNSLTPIVEGERSQTGCVATAMAQMMNYQQYPASASFEGSYNVGNTPYKQSVSTTYSWPYHLAYGAYLPTADAGVLTMSYTPLQARSVAMLMRDCGYAVDMQYSNNGSGAMTYMAGKAFTEMFSYPQESVKYLIRDYFTDDEWMDMLYMELAANSPVLYAGGSDRSGGHAFVLHGVDADGLFYVNWGWQGMFDGYYAIDMLNPDGEDFTDGEEMVIGIRPAVLPTDVAQSCFVTDQPYTFSYDKNAKQLTLRFTASVFNAACQAFGGRLCLVVEDISNPENTEYLDLLEEGTILDTFWGFNAWNGTVEECTFEPGSYRIYFATLDVDEVDWQYIRTIGGAFYYDLTVTAGGEVTIANDPTFVTIAPEATPVRDIPQQQPGLSPSVVRYYDLQGREVGATAKGLVIVRQGNSVKKIVSPNQLCR